MPKDSLTISATEQLRIAEQVIATLREAPPEAPLSPLAVVLQLTKSLDMYGQQAVWRVVRWRLGSRGEDRDLIADKKVAWHDRKFARDNGLMFVSLIGAYTTTIKALEPVKAAVNTVPVAGRQAVRNIAERLQEKAGRRLDETTVDFVSVSVSDLAEALADERAARVKAEERAERAEQMQQQILRLTGGDVTGFEAGDQPPAATRRN